VHGYSTFYRPILWTGSRAVSGKIKIKWCNFFFLSGTAAQHGLLDHTQRRATLGRTPLDE
jgi:hypothetical protein